MIHRAILSFILLLQAVSTLQAQNTIHGVVIDKETRQAVSDVIVQYGNLSSDYDYTKIDGKYTLPSTSNGVIMFQCIGYKSLSVSLINLQKNPVVEMELDPVYLNPVVINPDDADKILDEVMVNTKKNLLLKQPICYLLHFVQTNTADTLKNDIYMQYATTLAQKDLKKNMKNARVPYTFNLIDIARVEKSVIPTSEQYGAEYHASHLFTFGKSKNNETRKSYSSDSTLITLSIKPLPGRGGWASGEVIINRQDMTIMSMEIQSVDSVLEAEDYKKYMGKQLKVTKKVGRFAFKEIAGKRYMTDCYTFYKFKTVSETGKADEITYSCDVSFKGFIGKKQLRQRQLSGFCQELFYFPNSTTSEFWTQNNILDPTLSDDDSKYLGLDPKVYEEPSSAQRLLHGLRGSLIYIPIFVGLYFIQKAIK